MDYYLAEADTEVALRFVDAVERAVARSVGHRATPTAIIPSASGDEIGT